MTFEPLSFVSRPADPLRTSQINEVELGRHTLLQLLAILVTTLNHRDFLFTTHSIKIARINSPSLLCETYNEQLCM